ncbi:lymphatic vessel endothelial hyaluronic acid receptor 1a [Pholidichthys leucotaenia]
MNILCLCITSVLTITSVFSAQDIDMDNIRVFPAVNQTIAGVVLVTQLDSLNQPQYAFNVTDARWVCSSLGLTMASKTQVEEALSGGLETCRFGWIDEHFAVIPRIHALAKCGQNRTGLVSWRANAMQKFDVFCFNESDAATQLKDAATDIPLTSPYSSEHTTSTQTTHYMAPDNPSPTIKEEEAEPARFVSSAQRSTGAKAVIIVCTCGLLLTAVIITAYLKLRRCYSSTDMTQQQEDMETAEWTCVKDNKETKTATGEEERIEMCDTAQ